MNRYALKFSRLKGEKLYLGHKIKFYRNGVQKIWLFFFWKESTFWENQRKEGKKSEFFKVRLREHRSRLKSIGDCTERDVRWK